MYKYQYFAYIQSYCRHLESVIEHIKKGLIAINHNEHEGHKKLSNVASYIV